MKQGWEYKKLGEVCETCSGGTPSKSHTEYYEGGTIPWLRSGEVSQGNIYTTELFITEQGLANSSAKMIPENTVSITMYGATIGEVGIIRNTMCTNQAICNILPNKTYKAEFLRYFLISQKEHFIKKAAGGAQPNISQDIIRNTLIPLPPLSTQQSIVAELDEINNLLSLKRKELETYDKLAQSVFYEMFGDPVENEKGWEVKKFSDTYRLKSGEGLSAKAFKEGDIPVYGGNGISGYHDSYNMDGKYIIIGRVGVYCGNVREVQGKFWLTDNAFQLFYDEQSQDSCFVHYLLELLNLRKYANAAAQPVISNLTLKGIDIPLPPLPLQQTFAARIEAIEEQKASVKAAIEKLETLLAARMQYWFE